MWVIPLLLNPISHGPIAHPTQKEAQDSYVKAGGTVIGSAEAKASVDGNLRFTLFAIYIVPARTRFRGSHKRCEDEVEALATAVNKRRRWKESSNAAHRTLFSQRMIIASVCFYATISLSQADLGNGKQEEKYIGNKSSGEGGLSMPVVSTSRMPQDQM